MRRSAAHLMGKSGRNGAETSSDKAQADDNLDWSVVHGSS